MNLLRLVKTQTNPFRGPFRFPRADDIHGILRGHLAELYDFYGEEAGVRIARKHISWYTKGLIGAAHFRHAMNQLQSVGEQLAAADEFFLGHAAANDRLPYADRLEERVWEMRAA